MHLNRPRFAVAAALLLLPLVWGAGVARAQPAPFNVLLEPACTEVNVGDFFTVTLAVDSTAMQFNAYDVTIRFDPAILAFVDVDQGALMQPPQCPSPWFTHSQTDSTVRIEHAILCSGVSVDGPGQLSIITFEALANGVSQLEWISDPDFSFGDAGFNINPGHPTFPRQVEFFDAFAHVGTAPLPPVCDAGGPYGGEVDELIPFDGGGSSDSDGYITTYAWDFGDGQTGEGVTVDHGFSAAGLYTVTLCVTDNCGLQSCCPTTAEIGDVNSVHGTAPTPIARLAQNVPNPFNPSTEIGFSTAAPGTARLTIWNSSGRLIWSRDWPRLAAGTHRITWRAVDQQGRALPSGVYTYRLSTSQTTEARKMVLVR